ncbi:MAG: hypothetical protein RL662_2047 [Bacteroidota bacterium]
MDIFHQILHQYWGYSAFRPLQQDIINSVYSGKDTLGLMPTGGGKSITFQVPTMAMDGTCLVITPLIALMKDQVDNLRQRGIKALAIYSGMSHREIVIALENAILGDFKFLYISPERLGTELFKTKLRDMNICMITVDESHCISQWGYDFRPSYMNIAAIREQLPHVPLLALTATATPEVTLDIQTILQFKVPNLFKKSFSRSNLSYIVRLSEDKTMSLVDILSKTEGSAIVYVRSRQRTKDLAIDLVNKGFSADYYHAGLSSDDKNRKQNEWKVGICRIIVSTNAFGMGIDKSDVRIVIHHDLPNSLEEYYQEAGRAGRDEQPAFAVVLYTPTDSTKLKKRISDEFPERDFIAKVYESLSYYFQIAEGFGAGRAYDFNIYQFCSVYKYPISTTHNALKIIDLLGYIEYTDEVDGQSRLMFSVYRDELYKYAFDESYEQLIHTILRLYTGVFSDYVGIDEGAIAIRIGKSRTEVYEMLKYLSKRHIIDYIPFKKTPFVVYNKSRVPLKYFVITKDVYEKRKERFVKRVTGITEYVEQSSVCRSRMLLTYFGEAKSKDCGQCDVCRQKRAGGITNYRFNTISDQLFLLLGSKKCTVKEIVEHICNYDQKQVIEVIRFHLDQRTLCVDDDCIMLNWN